MPRGSLLKMLMVTRNRNVVSRDTLTDPQWAEVEPNECKECVVDEESDHDERVCVVKRVKATSTSIVEVEK